MPVFECLFPWIAAKRAAAEKAAREAAENVEAERLAAENVEAERLAAEKAEAERLAALTAAREAAEKAAREAAEKAEAESIRINAAAEKAEEELGPSLGVVNDAHAVKDEVYDLRAIDMLKVALNAVKMLDKAAKDADAVSIAMCEVYEAALSTRATLLSTVKKTDSAATVKKAKIAAAELNAAADAAYKMMLFADRIVAAAVRSVKTFKHAAEHAKYCISRNAAYEKAAAEEAIRRAALTPEERAAEDAAAKAAKESSYAAYIARRNAEDAAYAANKKAAADAAERKAESEAYWTKYYASVEGFMAYGM